MQRTDARGEDGRPDACGDGALLADHIGTRHAAARRIPGVARVSGHRADRLAYCAHRRVAQRGH